MARLLPMLDVEPFRTVMVPYLYPTIKDPKLMYFSEDCDQTEGYRVLVSFARNLINKAYLYEACMRAELGMLVYEKEFVREVWDGSVEHQDSVLIIIGESNVDLRACCEAVLSDESILRLTGRALHKAVMYPCFLK